MSNININKLKNFDLIGAAREAKVNNAGKTDSRTIENKTAASGEDKLNFSNRVGEFGKLVDTLRELPDVRQDRVESLREKIQSGDYNPSGEEIANAIFRDEK
jgi:negative regulator of flagellin synthesis FlgM